MAKLDGKIIIVAGAGGIGTGLAKRYAEDGATVILGDLDGKATREVAAAIGSSVCGIALDGADEASVRAAVDFAVREHGGLDGFHANFASFRDNESGGDIVDLSLDAYDEVMRVNARGFVLCTRSAIPGMLARGGGTMLYTSSGAAFIGEPVRTAYAMSKSAIHALMRSVARRFGQQGVRANAITPGLVTHARFEQVMDPAVVAELAARNLVGRLG